jgi:hypothetical protein
MCLKKVEDMSYNNFCKSKNCPEYIEWDFEMGAKCTSCKLVGQSYNIEEIPENCLFKEEIEKL